MKTITIKTAFSGDHITRQAGEILRREIIDGAGDEPVTIDFSGIVIASTSFLDEGLAKLRDEGWNAEQVERLIRLQAIDPRDLGLLERLSIDRWGKKYAPRWPTI